MYNDAEDENGSVSRNIYMLTMLCQSLGLTTLLIVPHRAVAEGALGNAVVYFFVYMLVGIPLSYTEYVVGQFTGRDCLEVWQARPCLGHFGYIQLAWQIMFALYYHTMASFVFHYFLVSFHSTIAYHTCGWWSNSDCDILRFNHTVNEYCIKKKDAMPFCDKLSATFPEYQYWRFYVLGINKSHFHYPWHVCLGCGLLSAIVFLCYFRRMRSFKYVLIFITIYPVISRLVFFAGSMLQKGIAKKFEEAIDLDFVIFSKYFDFESCVTDVLLSLNVGTGLGFNLGSKAPFRAPCYSNMVVVVVIAYATAVLGVCSVAMLACPYSYTYEINPIDIMANPIANIFEKVPRLLYEYENKRFWLLLSFSFVTVSTMSLVTLTVSGLIEIVVKRSHKLTNNPDLMAGVASLALFIFTAPMLGNTSLYYMVDLKHILNNLMIFLVVMENCIFVLWYGLGRFFEDIHFMQGIPPKLYIKVCWALGTVVACYIFCMRLYEIYLYHNVAMSYFVGYWLLLGILALSLLITVFKLLVAFYKNKFKEAIRLDPNWGPRSEILRRSRTMFTAQAMTKEYMYRQYHLKAGMLMRQRTSNVRGATNVDLEK